MNEITIHHHVHFDDISIRLMFSWGRQIDPLKPQLKKMETRLMATLQDIKDAALSEGDKVDKLVALTDAIFAKVSAAPSDDPLAQEVLDLIAAHNSTIDSAMARDTMPDTSQTS